MSYINIYIYVLYIYIYIMFKLQNYFILVYRPTAYTQKGWPIAYRFPISIDCNITSNCGAAVQRCSGAAVQDDDNKTKNVHCASVSVAGDKDLLDLEEQKYVETNAEQDGDGRLLHPSRDRPVVHVRHEGLVLGAVELRANEGRLVGRLRVVRRHLLGVDILGEVDGDAQRYTANVSKRRINEPGGQVGVAHLVGQRLDKTHIHRHTEVREQRERERE